MSEREIDVHPASFRDPSGFIFFTEGKMYRQVNKIYREHYDMLMNSGLYATLTGKELLVAHSETDVPGANSETSYKVLAPEIIPFISYPYEWCFGMLKEAALLTLRIAREALAHDMVLKDASPYNVQWKHNRMVFIDTLSFEKYIPGTPWVAYRQFCECFLAPLLLMHHRKVSLHEWQLAYPAGIPLAIAKKFLPWKSRLSILTYLHIHLHGKIASKHAIEKDRKAVLPKEKLHRLIKSLDLLVSSLKMDNRSTTWGSYYNEAALREDYLEQKKKIIEGWLNKLPDCKTGIDLGANDGSFSALLASKGIATVAVDGDPAAIADLYAKTRSGVSAPVVPLIINLADPSPARGVNNRECAAFLERANNRDIGLCLALVHHLRISHHMSFEQMTQLFKTLCKNLIIEFVPLQDEKVQEMLALRKESFEDYTQENFEAALGKHFSILEKQVVAGTGRILYLLTRESSATDPK